MTKRIRIGTRESKLALWQAMQVQQSLNEDAGCETLLELIKSDGDINLIKPLYELGVQGIFTKALDIALLENRIDIAVHSYKDVPVQLPEGLTIAAVLKRGNPFDMLVCRNEQTLTEVVTGAALIIASSSIRRKAQWLARYPNSSIENIRGNVQTRLQKLQQSNWHGTIFAAAGLERLGITDTETGPQLLLDWMLPAPAQGAIVVICRKEDASILQSCFSLNHQDTATCTLIERSFMRMMMGGCSTPISAYATVVNDRIDFDANITAPNGSNAVVVNINAPINEASQIASRAFEKMKEGGVEKHLYKF